MGYDKNQKEKFFGDAGRLTHSFKKWEPYSRFTSCFNVTAFFLASQQKDQSDSSNELQYKTSFSTLGVDRYLMANDIVSLRNALCCIGYDYVCLIVNSPEYGGGGIYNYLTVLTSDHYNAEFLFQHEFAHTFAGLADEYYSSTVSYINMFPPDLEPYQPNITTLVDFNTKWANMVNDTVPVPTPNERQYNRTVGVFEGAGYSPKGVYRSYYTCAMKSSDTEYFCPVCSKAIEKTIKQYCKE